LKKGPFEQLDLTSYIGLS